MTEILADQIRARWVGTHLGTVLIVEVVCCAPECCAREIRVRLKNHGTGLPGSVRCPICGGTQLALQSIRTFVEDERTRDRAARARVNWQMYGRDHAVNGIAAIPFSILKDDRLPPTPAGWWEKTTRRAGP
jgi:hypothetical protein